MQKTIKLGLAGRYVLAELLVANTDGGKDAQRAVRELWRGLKLYEASQKSNELVNAKADEAKREGPTEPPKPVTWDDLDAAEPAAEYQIDDTYLRWLQKRLDEHDWGKHLTREGKEIRLPVAPMLLCVVADVADAVADALRG